MKKVVTVAIVATSIVGVFIVGFLLYRTSGMNAYDAALQQALDAVQKLKNYEVQVETTTVLSDRKIDVLGLYRLNFTESRYGSYATTTLTIPSEPRVSRYHVFSLNNVSIGNDIYLFIDTSSPLLQKTIPYSDQWRHLLAHAIPAQFRDIAVSGPVLDNLALLSSRGKYLTLIGEPGNRTLGTQAYRVYSFTLSDAASRVESGTLKNLIGRIGTGSIDIWLDASSSIRLMTIDGENYRSTTTIKSVNTPLDIHAPDGVE